MRSLWANCQDWWLIHGFTGSKPWEWQGLVLLELIIEEDSLPTLWHTLEWYVMMPLVLLLAVIFQWSDNINLGDWSTIETKRPECRSQRRQRFQPKPCEQRETERILLQEWPFIRMECSGKGYAMIVLKFALLVVYMYFMSNICCVANTVAKTSPISEMLVFAKQQQLNNFCVRIFTLWNTKCNLLLHGGCNGPSFPKASTCWRYGTESLGVFLAPYFH